MAREFMMKQGKIKSEAEMPLKLADFVDE